MSLVRLIRVSADDLESWRRVPRLMYFVVESLEVEQQECLPLLEPRCGRWITRFEPRQASFRGYISIMEPWGTVNIASGGDTVWERHIMVRFSWWTFKQPLS